MTQNIQRARRTLANIDHYPMPKEIFTQLQSSQGWPYKKDMAYYQLRDRAFVSVQYLLGLRISEVLRLLRKQIDYPGEKENHIIVSSIALSKARWKGVLRKRQFRQENWLPLKGERKELTQLVLDYLEQFDLEHKNDERLFPFARRRGHQICIALLGIPDHWLRAYCENYLYDEWDHDILACSDYFAVDSRTLGLYIRRGYKKYKAH
jgi:integrase